MRLQLLQNNVTSLFPGSLLFIKYTTLLTPSLDSIYTKRRVWSDEFNPFDHSSASSAGEDRHYDRKLIGLCNQ